MRFVDRRPKKPNRYKITSENGGVDYVVIERADEPEENGTPLNAETMNAILDDVDGKAPQKHTHKKSEITDFPSSMTPTAHNQAANTITAGTFGGQVVANSSGQTPGTSLLRNIRLVSTDTNPTVNGEICLVYE